MSNTDATPACLATPLRACASPTCSHFFRWGQHGDDGHPLSSQNRLRLCYSCAAVLRAKRRVATQVAPAPVKEQVL